jgi:hypothetical protein
MQMVIFAAQRSDNKPWESCNSCSALSHRVNVTFHKWYPAVWEPTAISRFVYCFTVENRIVGNIERLRLWRKLNNLFHPV